MAEPREKAEKDYMAGMKYKDIAAKYNTTINTVKSWKKRYWGERKEGVQPKVEKLHPQKKVAPLPDDGTKETLQNKELTPEQQLFCIYYSKTFNATQSYLKAYGCTYESALVNGSRLLGNARVRAEVERLKEIKRQMIVSGTEDIVELQMRIAFADMGNYLSFGKEEVPVMAMYGPVQITDEETGEKVPLTQTVNKVLLNESGAVDTQLIQEVKEGRNGVSIKLADRQKAIDWLTKYFQMNPSDRHREEYDKRKLELELLKIENQVKETVDEPEQAEDNFLDALNESAQDAWKDG